jgi:GNAT superfamily N-acetyltransferase
MSIRIAEESSDALPGYAAIPIAFKVESRFRVDTIAQGLGGLRLVEERVPAPYIKDYDQDPGEGPLNWAKRWDISSWGFLSAFEGAQRVGAAALVWRTPGIHMLEERDDLAVLWDIRVAAGYRHHGIGSKVFARAVDWARQRHCRVLKAETQNINVPACRFYASQGCVLRGIHVGVYPAYPEEVQLLWYRDLK